VEDKKQVKNFNVPNAISVFRLLILPLFVWFFMEQDENRYYIYYSFIILAVSWFSDFLDGFIARRFHLITDLGKFLDPLADKTTQAVTIVCLSIRIKEIIPLAALMIAKELLQGIGGYVIFKRKISIRPARWFGKIATGSFYAATILIVVWRDMPRAVLFTLIALLACVMVFTFVNYLFVYQKLMRTSQEGGEPQIDDA